MRSTENILGYDVSIQDMDSCVGEIKHALDHGTRAFFFACANPHSLWMAEADNQFKQALRDADLLTPDGAGILLASRILGGTLRERITGNDVFDAMNITLNESGKYKYFFLGSTEINLQIIQEKMAVEYPNIEIVGVHSPPFKEVFSDADNIEMVRAINAAKPDVLWVGMTAPKQEKWIHQHLSQLDVKFVGAIGAVFDFYTGNIKRSHPLFQRAGLEWLPRLIRQPKRLWRRMFVSAPRFLWLVILQKIKITN